MNSSSVTGPSRHVRGERQVVPERVPAVDPPVERQQGRARPLGDHGRQGHGPRDLGGLDGRAAAWALPADTPAAPASAPPSGEDAAIAGPRRTAPAPRSRMPRPAALRPGARRARAARRSRPAAPGRARRTPGSPATRSSPAAARGEERGPPAPSSRRRPRGRPARGCSRRRSRPGFSVDPAAPASRAAQSTGSRAVDSEDRDAPQPAPPPPRSPGAASPLRARLVGVRRVQIEPRARGDVVVAARVDGGDECGAASSSPPSPSSAEPSDRSPASSSRPMNWTRLSRRSP